MALDLKLAQALAKQLRGNYFLTSFFFMCFSAQPGGGFVPECLDGHCVPAAGIQTIFLNETFTQNDGNDWNFF